MTHSALPDPPAKKSTYVRFLSRFACWQGRRGASRRASSTSCRLPDPPQARPLVLADGVRLRLRPLHRTDRSALREFFQRLSAHSRRQRFLATRPPLTETELDGLLALRPGTHWSWVVEYPDRRRSRLAGVAQACRPGDTTDEAEIAVAVLDGFHGRGLGPLLLAAVAAEALAAGIERLHAYTLADNRRILTYAQRRDATLRYPGDGTVLLNLGARRLAAELPPLELATGPEFPAHTPQTAYANRFPLTAGY